LVLVPGGGIFNSSTLTLKDSAVRLVFKAILRLLQSVLHAHRCRPWCEALVCRQGWVRFTPTTGV